ncbi:MAG: glutamine amidotransferase [Polyangiaceae bacterium]|nr:glutamine amidotransferase [Polyangiaceae bacterium]
MTLADSTWSFSEDFSPFWVGCVFAVAALALLLVWLDAAHTERRRALVLLSGGVATVALVFAILRPVSVVQRSNNVGSKVLVLVDGSVRLRIPSEGSTRRARALGVAKALAGTFKEARLTLLEFSDGALKPLAKGDDESGVGVGVESDLTAALAEVGNGAEEKPQAIIVVSDGQFSHPGKEDDLARITQLAGGVPIHTVSLAEKDPPDVAIRAVRAAGAAVAHQPLALTIEVSCTGGAQCHEIPVEVRELRYGVPKALLASGKAQVNDGAGKIELQITLDRAGTRVVEVAIAAPDGDSIPENNSRVIAFTVTRDRIRLLHVAGRPTYDVRSLRMWLKSDESVDLIAFFILRGNEDDTRTTSDSELALIPFPVEELFTEHLPSFDAVVIQDLDAVAYKLARHLPALARYVESGGGLIMVGGPTSFSGGRYAGTELERVLPIKLSSSEKPFDLEQFVPAYTDSGRAAPVLRGLRDLLGEKLPEMPGTNILGVPRDNSLVLWEHPRLKAGDRSMPVLALGEAGDGRSIALGVDGTHLLAMSELGADVEGRGFGALWDGLLGWLMRDPRFEAARTEVVGECLEGQKTTLVLTRLPTMKGDISLTLERLGATEKELVTRRIVNPPPGPLKIEFADLKAGGYIAKATIGSAPPTRYDFACERGGQAWSDTRVDPERLAKIARATGGKSVVAEDVGKLPVPKPAQIASERRVEPLFPAWGWSLAAAVALGVHWLVRRQGGLV